MAEFTASSKGNPCPICSRTKDGDCRISASLVLCHHGSEHHPPAGLKPGDVVGKWAFTGNTADDRAATFTRHKPRHEPVEPPTRGAEAFWRYSGTFVVTRFPGKRILPLSWDGSRWIWRAPKGLRPLLLSQSLQQEPDATVLIVEGEKTFDAARRLLPGVIACCWSGGCKALSKTDFTPLRGRKVVLWPDNDDPGREAMAALAQVLDGIGAANVKAVANPDDAPKGWDLADADWTPEQASDWVKANTTAVERSNSKPAKTSKPEHKARPMSHTKAMACFDRCVVVQASRERNSLRRRARLLKAAKDLGLAAYINRQEIAQRVMEAKDRATGGGFKSLTAADRAAMPKPVVHWLLSGLVPAVDMTIIGGRPKVGKTRLAVAIAAAVLTGKPLLGFPAPSVTRPVILVTDDQADGDTADMLEALHLWDHPALVWSRSFRLTEPDVDSLLETVKANPGAVVELDSLRSIGRSLQHGENDPEIGATLYDLKQAVIDNGGTLLLIHHCNKTADLVGVEALSGHSAISGAANTVLTMHYLPGANGQPDKASPERRLVREARSGEGFDLVIARDGNSFRKVSDLGQWQQQQKQSSKLEKLTNVQQQVLDALEASNEWMTRRQVCDAIGAEWGDRGRCPEAQQVTRSLQRLVEIETIESARTGNESTYRALHSAQIEKSSMSPMPFSDTKGSQWHHDLMPLMPPVERTGCGISGITSANRLNPLPRLDVIDVFGDLPVQAPIPGFIDPSPVPVGSGADVMGDTYDRHWPERR
ncbi:AAA family ATPase [Cyanobium sp. WAJ14-Wanaka]|uniref:AAA family ATPase n=1 Tax=Cyanobium sp. WAJ14-Wanaka TaxID=2823725 RepID=UPI0020CC2144|nr:AAA family ATPase [Cyanobium sp. WAJ14-Wanaka]MCP9776219.1 AAA family ATPase [Cyanobium sp. WAJ14-Wanaka]